MFVMDIQIFEHHFQLNDLQREYILGKMETLAKHLGKIGEDASVEAKVSMTKEDTKADDDRFLCEVTILLPKHNTLRCQTRALTSSAAIDLSEEKLKKQIEKLRTKLIG